PGPLSAVIAVSVVDPPSRCRGVSFAHVLQPIARATARTVGCTSRSSFRAFADPSAAAKVRPSAKTQVTVMKAIAAALLLATGIALVAAAQTAADFPSRPVKLLVPFAAGGPTDVVARILADLLSARWGGQSVVIENRPGAGTIVATAALAKAPAD